MIKEVIEDLPGGKMFILAQRSRGLISGIMFGMFLSSFLSMMLLTDFSNFIDVHSYILKNIIVQTISVLIMVLIGVVIYHKQICKAQEQNDKPTDNYHGS